MTRKYRKATPGSDEVNNLFNIGFGRPPAEHQFQKGQSGNPKGRPKKEQISRGDASEFTSADEELFKAINRKVTVTEAGTPVRRSISSVFVQMMIQQALKGDVATQKYLLNEARQAESRRNAVIAELQEEADSYRRGYDRMVQQHWLNKGEPVPDHVPRPEDVIDRDYFYPYIRGAKTQSEVEDYDYLRNVRDFLIAKLRYDLVVFDQPRRKEGAIAWPFLVIFPLDRFLAKRHQLGDAEIWARLENGCRCLRRELEAELIAAAQKIEFDLPDDDLKCPVAFVRDPVGTSEHIWSTVRQSRAE